MTLGCLTGSLPCELLKAGGEEELHLHTRVWFVGIAIKLDQLLVPHTRCYSEINATCASQALVIGLAGLAPDVHAKRASLRMHWQEDLFMPHRIGTSILGGCAHICL